MIAAGVGQASDESGELAAREATVQAMEQADIAHADCAVVFATSDYSCEYTRILKRVHDIAGADHIVGCSGSGVLTSRGEIEKSSGVAVLTVASDRFECSSFLTACGAGETIDGEQFGRQVKSHISDESLLVILPDVFSIQPSRLLREVQSHLPRVPIVGGAASGNTNASETFQWRWMADCDSLNHCITRHGVSALLLNGEFETFIGIAQGCQPIGEPYLITKADGNLVYEIANRPAVEILQDAISTLPEEETSKVFGSLFAGLAMDEEKYPLARGDYLIRNLVGVQPATGALVIAEAVRVGRTIQFNVKDRHAAHEDMQQVLRDLSVRTASRKPVMGFYFNCLGRGEGLYGKSNHDIDLIREAFPDTTIVGFFGNAEFAPIAGRNLVHNYTGVLALIAERATE